MTAGRKPHTKPQFDDIEKTIDQPRFANAMTVMQEGATQADLIVKQHQAAVRAVATQVGYQLPADCADPDLIQRDIAANMRRTAEAMLQVGLGLLVLKEACQHGEFVARLEVLRFEPRVAQKYMQVARKVSNAPTSAHLLKAFDSQSKLLELIAIDDEQIEELVLTGQTGELKLDDVASMSVKELRAKVRELRNEVTAKENRIAVKSRQLDEAEEKLERRKFLTQDQVLNELRQTATKEFGQVKAYISAGLYSVVRSIKNHHEANGGDSEELLAGLAAEVKKALQIMCDELFIADISEKMIPEYLTDPRFNEFLPTSPIPPNH